MLNSDDFSTFSNDDMFQIITKIVETYLHSYICICIS